MKPLTSISDHVRKILRHLALFFLCLCQASWGHDTVGGALYRLRYALFGWPSRPPVVDASLRSKIRENVLLCIGATNRNDAVNFEKRYNASENLGTDLSAEELKLLYSFLDGSLGGHDPLWAQDIILLKGSICTSVNWMSGGRPPDGFGFKLKDMIAMRTLDMEWRRACVHHLASYYNAKWKDDPARMSNPERKSVEEYLVKLARGKQFSYEVLQELSVLSEVFPEIKAVVDANKFTPLPFPP